MQRFSPFEKGCCFWKTLSLSRSIQNLFEEEAEPAVSRTKLVDPFEEPKEFDSASADPFAELEKQSVKPSAKMATPKDPFAELASVSHSAPVALKDPFAELSSVSHSAPVALKDPFADLASSKAPATPKDPFAELSSVSHSAPATSVAPATPAMKSAGPKSVPLIPSATVQAKPTPAEVKIPQSPVAQNVTALLKDKGSAKVNETKVVKLNSTKSAANRNHGTAQKVVASNQMKMNHNDSIHSAPTLPAEIKIQPTKRSHFLHPKVEAKMTSPEATPQPAQVAPNLQRSPSSLAAFWSSEPRRPPEPNPKMAPLALVQHQAARKGIDFTKVQETKEDGELEISISHLDAFG